MAQVNTDQLLKKKDALTHQEQLANTFRDGAFAVLGSIRNSGLMIAGNQKPGQSPGDDKSGDNRHDKDWPPPAPLKKASLNNNMMIAHEGHTPDSTYDDYGRPEDVPRYKGGNPGGQLIEIPWMKEEYKKKHPQLEQLHNDKYHQAKVSYGKPTPLDEYFKEVGYPTKDMSPEERLKIMRGAPKA